MYIFSVNAYVFNTKFFDGDIEVVIKTPKRRDPSDDFCIEKENFDIVREYFLGVSCFNKLRYFIPTFVYTFGAFACNETEENTTELTLCSLNYGINSPHIIYEKIKGNSVQNLLDTRKINFKQWLEIFSQLLLTLEVAQRKFRFTHFDLHLGNVMINNSCGKSYYINLDNTTYKISPKNYPVIIDFGMSSVYVNDRYIGAYGFESYGMCSFMIPGCDMYKFLINSLFYAKGKLKKELINIFKFYGDNDPYNIVKSEKKNASIAKDEFYKQITYSSGATYTPYMFYLWLKDKYSDLISPIISSHEREDFMILQYSNSLQKYNNIFKQNKYGRDSVIELVKKCISNVPSYISISYNIMVLSRYNDKLKSKDIDIKIDILKNIINSIKKTLIESDKVVLEKVFDIFHPDEKDLHNACNNVLKIGIRHHNPDDKISTVKILTKLLKYRKKIKPYLNLLYTIREINQYELFKDWCDRFLKSDIYTFYEDNNIYVERANRWGMTLMASINYSCEN